MTKPVGKVPAASARCRREAAEGPGCLGQQNGRVVRREGQAGSEFGSAPEVRRLRNLIASLIWLVAVIAAAVLALGALFTALDQTNQSNEIVRWVLERGQDLVGPFKDLFRLETAKNTLLVNWGIAALVYLIAGKTRTLRPSLGLATRMRSRDSSRSPGLDGSRSPRAACFLTSPPGSRPTRRARPPVERRRPSRTAPPKSRRRLPW